jgi:single-stranded-DNA-specific exonuclease
VDCGTSAVEAVKHANDLGIDVVVTDHHEVGEALSLAYVIVNPKKPGCPYPFKGLAGVGVAFKFAEALVRAAGYDVETYRRRFCDLFAVGTVADIVPLMGENRVLVKYGMDELPRSGKKGLKALMEVARLSGKTVTSQSLAFVIAPRINAAGRVGDASVALDLLLSKDDAEAFELAGKVDAQNRERQAEQERIVGEALSRIEEGGLCEKCKVLVVAKDGWHPGIIGIVASKITERFCRPTVMVAVNETGETGVGSARSIEAFDLFGSISKCGHLLERFGGHAKAAGLSINMRNLPEFTAAINRIADESLTEQDLLPQIAVDAELDLGSVTLDLAKELELLEPIGHGNRQPVFMSRGAVVLQKSRIGSAGAHLKLRLGRSGLRAVECVAFGWGDREESFKLGSCIDLCYNIQANRFGGQETVQMVLRDARPSAAQILDEVPPANLA